MKSLRATILLVATFTLTSCSTVSVTTDYDHTAAFGTYKTYSLAPGPDGSKLPVYCEMALRKTIRSELTARGVTEVKGHDADLAIVWHVYLDQRTSAQERRDPEGDLAYAYGNYTYWTGMPANLANSTKYPDGTLILDVVDMKTNTLVFRGSGEAIAMGPERSAKNIEKAVKKMIAALPAVH
jgi:hypothetical protein